MAGRLGELRGQFVHHRRQAAHLAHLPDLLLEIVQIKAFSALQLLRKLDRLLLVDPFLRFLDQRQNVTHPENTGSHSFRMKGFETRQLLSNAGELDRLARHVTNRKCGTASRITIQLGQNDAGQRQRLAERLRRIDRVLPEHGVNDKQRFDGGKSRMKLSNLLHHCLVDRQPSCRIDKQHMRTLLVVLSYHMVGEEGLPAA